MCTVRDLASPSPCAAHIFGGTVDEFRALAEACANWTLMDREAGIKAVWDDESYLQRWEPRPCPLTLC